MAFTFTQVVLGSTTLSVNPSKADQPRELLQTIERALDGSLLVSYVPDPDDPTKIATKRRFALSGADPDGSVVEAIEAEIVKAPPLAFTDSEGRSHQVAAESFDSGQDAATWQERAWKLGLVEV